MPVRIGYKIKGDRLELSFAEGRLQGTWTFKRYSQGPSAEKVKNGENAQKAGDGDRHPFERQLGRSLALPRWPER